MVVTSPRVLRVALAALLVMTAVLTAMAAPMVVSAESHQVNPYVGAT
jgi:hypothetical protein